jgi:hypothetical protein
LAEGRVADAFAALETAELSGTTRRILDGLEAAYLAEEARYRALIAQVPAASDVS